MISKDIKNVIYHLFWELAKTERIVEVSHQIFCESKDFDAHQIFNFLLSNNQKNITPVDIIKFVSKNKIKINEEEANLIILFYDKNLDGKLSFDEFINLIKSEKSSINNKSFNYSDDINISFNINFSLCKLFEKEILISKSIINILKILKNKYGFNIHDIYHFIKSTNFITSESIKNFLNNNNTEYLESDINLIMKRLDINRDGKVDLCEFHSLLGFPNCAYSCLSKKCKTCGAGYCEECYIDNHGCNPHNLNYPYNYKYNNNGIENNNPNIKNTQEIKYQSYDNFNDNTLRLLQGKKTEIINDENDNIVNYDKLKSYTDIKDKTNEIQQFNNYIRFLLENENKIEKIKIDLCNNKEFNVEDTFRLFEKNGRGSSTKMI